MARRLDRTAPAPSRPRRTAPRNALAETADAETTDLGPLPGLIGYVIRRVQLLVFHDFISAMARHRIRPAQYSALTVIALNPGVTQARLSRALGIKRANMVAMIDELERRRLARRVASPHDRRTQALQLTPQGASFLRQLDEVVREHEARVTRGVGADGMRRLFGLLDDLAAPLTADAVAPRKPDRKARRGALTETVIPHNNTGNR